MSRIILFVVYIIALVIMGLSFLAMIFLFGRSKIYEIEDAPEWVVFVLGIALVVSCITACALGQLLRQTFN